MKYKKILFLFLILGIVLTGCGKKEEVPEPTEVAIDVPTTIPTEAPRNTPVPTKEPEVVSSRDATLEELQNLQIENKYLNEFLKELLTLQENKMLEAYNQITVGDSHKHVMETLASFGFRYDEQVHMVTCYDEAKSPINMQDRTGIVAFDRMYLTLDEEKQNLTSTETSKKYLELLKQEEETETETEEDTTKVEKNSTTEESATSLILEETTSEEASTETEKTQEITNPNVPEGAKILETSKNGDVLIESVETPERVYQILDVNTPVYHSYIAFTFNDLNVLVGKFKYFDRLEWYPKELNEEILNGSLDGNVSNISLKISKDADALTIYEKMDEVRTVIEENDKNITSLEIEYFPKFTEFFDSITEESHMKKVLDEVDASGFNIEKINKTVLNELNKRFQRNYTEGYYISLIKDEEHISPDLRYKDVYISILFNDKNNMYYKCLVTPDGINEQCKDILDINDYELNDIYKAILSLDKDIVEFNNQRTYFTDYLDKNIALFNSKLEFNETRDYILNEIEKSGLEYKENFENTTITSYMDETNLTIKAFKDNGEPNYDECILIYGGSKDIYLFFKEGIVYGIYRTDYFDISDITITNYTNLKTVLEGLENLDLELDNKKQELVQYTNMLDNRLSSFRADLGYATNHKEGQIYTKADVLKALELGGYSYEEGMNKGDGLYFIGIRRMPTDEDYSLKVYFNEDEEIEIIK